ncbi:ABC transporter permease [Endozoicomonas lisbonensis]|uniref:ABC transport system permease protein n=1 Tax=Endozoicomonas lisbonensis TaxID=3120522 RepID=A0ABV2SPE2_9GAMM
MKFIETLLTALSALAAHKLRSFLTMLGIIIGVSSVVVMMGLGGGAQKQVEAQLDSMGTNMLLVRGPSRQDRGVSQGAGGVATLQQADARFIAEEVQGVSYAAPWISGSVQVVSGNSNWSTRVNGITADFLYIHNWQLAYDQQIDQLEFRTNGKDVIIGSTVAEELFGRDNPLGQQIRINKVPFTVQGVLESKGEDARGSDQDDIMMVPIQTARRSLFGTRRGLPTAVDSIWVQVAELDDMEWVGGEINALLEQRYRIKPGSAGFRITNMTERLKMRAEAGQVFNSLLAGVACVSLLVGGIGIMNIMLVSVTERTREIGVRLALGARQADVLAQFLIEAIVLCGIGGLLGIGVAVIGLFGAEYLTGLPVYIEWWISIVSVLFSALIGLFFGFYPARKASRLNPVDALRYD